MYIIALKVCAIYSIQNIKFDLPRYSVFLTQRISLSIISAPCRHVESDLSYEGALSYVLQLTSFSAKDIRSMKSVAASAVLSKLCTDEEGSSGSNHVVILATISKPRGCYHRYREPRWFFHRFSRYHARTPTQVFTSSNH